MVCLLVTYSVNQHTYVTLIRGVASKNFFLHYLSTSLTKILATTLGLAQDEAQLRWNTPSVAGHLAESGAINPGWNPPSEVGFSTEVE